MAESVETTAPRKARSPIVRALFFLLGLICLALIPLSPYVPLVPTFDLILLAAFNNLLGGVFMALMDAYGLELVSVEAWGLLWGFISLAFIGGGLVVATRGGGWPAGIPARYRNGSAFSSRWRPHFGLILN